MKGNALTALAVAAATWLLAAGLTAAPAAAQDEVTYLFPAPDFLPAFTPFQVARVKGYYDDAGLDVTWAVGKGGADVAKQVAVGNADLGGGIGDTPIIVRANGLPVKGVLLMGGKALTQMIIRDGVDGEGVSGLAGKRVGVMSFQDTTYYNLLAALAASGMGRDDVDIQAVGPGGMVQLMVSGDLDAISGTPDWAASIDAAGVATKVVPIHDLFPAMAQAVLVSDETIAERPQMVRAFVQATLKGLRDVMTDPEGSAALLAKSIPQFEGREAFLLEVMQRYNDLVYAVEDMDALGTFDAARMEAVSQFYLDNDIVRTKLPAEELFTNAFAAAQ